MVDHSPLKTVSCYSQHAHLSVFAFWKTHFLGKLVFVKILVWHTAHKLVLSAAFEFVAIPTVRKAHF